LPKLIEPALLITQADVTVICTPKVEVTVNASAALMTGSKRSAAKPSFCVGRLTAANSSLANMTTPRIDLRAAAQIKLWSFRDGALLIGLQLRRPAPMLLSYRG